MLVGVLIKATVLAAGLGTHAPVHHMPQPPAPHVQSYQPTQPLDLCGWYEPNNDTIYVLCRDRYTLAHEMGHVFDVKELTEPDRGVFTYLLGWKPGTPWASRVREQFADAYASCDLGKRPGRNWVLTPYSYAPTLRSFRRVCAQIVAVAKARGLSGTGA